MEINWDAIKYIFQIPKDWYRYIHRKIHNAYGTLFIRVMDGEYGGMKIDIDKQAFKDAVEEAVKERLKGRTPKVGTNSSKTMTKAEIMAIRDPELRQKMMLENRELFNF